MRCREFGKRHGHGTFVYANGDAYTGEWHAGTKHGEGRYRQKEFCCTYEGTWQHGVLLSSKVRPRTSHVTVMSYNAHGTVM